MTRRDIIEIAELMPTQMTVGMLQVKHKRAQLKLLERRPGELVDFILEHPIRVVIGPKKKAYVIDHHHLALALIKENFESAPMDIEHDLSSLSLVAFWKKMQALKCVHPFDAEGKRKSCDHVPSNLKRLKDDPYRSVAGFVREQGGFFKVSEPFAEFLWADYFRTRIKYKMLSKHFKKALKLALTFAAHPDAAKLPGYIPPTPSRKPS